jgi:sec-independent protein translocase protein TatA
MIVEGVARQVAPVREEPILNFLNVGPMELIVVLVVALVVLGPKRLPEIGAQLGRGLREFQRVQQELTSELTQELSIDVMTEGKASGTGEKKQVVEEIISVPPVRQSLPAAYLPPSTALRAEAVNTDKTDNEMIVPHRDA